MKKLIFLQLCAAVMALGLGLSEPAFAGLNKGNCTFDGKPLYGRVQIVDSFPDVKVKKVDNFADLDVKFVNSFPNDCGEWEIVKSLPDIRVQFVSNFPDVTIKVVNNFPGMN